MDGTQLKIYSSLTRNIDSHFTINGLTKHIKKCYDKGHYPNIHKKIKELDEQEEIDLIKIGRSYIIRLNFSNDILLDQLSEVELNNKERISREDPILKDIILKIESNFIDDYFFLDSISLVEPEKNIRLKRLEILMIFKDPKLPKEKLTEFEKIKFELLRNEIRAAYLDLLRIEKNLNIKIDPLFIESKDLDRYFDDDLFSCYKDQILKKITILYPQNYWWRFKENYLKHNISWSENECSLKDISNDDINFNLSRFGYYEIGEEIRSDTKIPIELIITRIFINDRARQINSIPLIIKKQFDQSPINMKSLFFLCKKFEQMEKLLGILELMTKFKKEDWNSDFIYYIEILKEMGIKAKQYDLDTIKKQMELYNAN